MLVNPPLFSFSFHTTNKTHSVGGKPHLFKNFYQPLDLTVQKFSFHWIHLIWGKYICWSHQQIFFAVMAGNLYIFLFNFLVGRYKKHVNNGPIGRCSELCFPLLRLLLLSRGILRVSGNKEKHVFPKTCLKLQNISNGRMQKIPVAKSFGILLGFLLASFCSNLVC